MCWCVFPPVVCVALVLGPCQWRVLRGPAVTVRWWVSAVPGTSRPLWWHHHSVHQPVSHNPLLPCSIFCPFPLILQTFSTPVVSVRSRPVTTRSICSHSISTDQFPLDSGCLLCSSFTFYFRPLQSPLLLRPPFWTSVISLFLLSLPASLDDFRAHSYFSCLTSLRSQSFSSFRHLVPHSHPF